MDSNKYKKFGVDLKKIKNIHDSLPKFLNQTIKNNPSFNVLEAAGHYSSILNIDGLNITIHTDGVGTKVLVAQMMNKYDTIGIDCVAMCVNDLLCVGSEPLALVDYIALEKTNDKLVTELITGLVKGSKLASVAIVGGETAIMPDVIKGFNGNGFDLAATVLGHIKPPNSPILGHDLLSDDIIVGIQSSGIHSNGFSLARNVLLKSHNLDDYIPELNKTIGSELLVPTAIYVNPILEILQNCEVHGLAHITGGAFSKLLRISKYKNLGFKLDNMPKPPPIFSLIQKEGKITLKEMYKTFNMGIGFCICLPKTELNKTLTICKKHGFEAMQIGQMSNNFNVVINNNLLIS